MQDHKDYVALSMRFNKKMHDAIREVAYKQDEKLAEIVRKAVDDYLIKLSDKKVLRYKSTLV